MVFLARIFFLLVMATNGILLLLGFYGYFWRGSFLRGEAAGPYWLLQLYDRVTPTLFYSAALALVIFTVLRLAGALFRVPAGRGAGRLTVALRLAVLLGAAAAIPACRSRFEPVQTVEFNEQQFHLLRQVHVTGVSYGVFRCEDVGSFYCEIPPEQTPWAVLFPLPEPTPLPLPTMTAVVEGELILLSPRLPTPTPSAELVVRPLSLATQPAEQLSLKVGDAWLGIDISEPTPTPLP